MYLFTFDLFQAKVILGVLSIALAVIPTASVVLLLYYLVTSLVATTLTDRAYMRWLSVCLIAYVSCSLLLGGVSIPGTTGHKAGNEIKGLILIQNPTNDPNYQKTQDTNANGGRWQNDSNIDGPLFGHNTQDTQMNTTFALNQPFESFSYLESDNNLNLAFDTSSHLASLGWYSYQGMTIFKLDATKNSTDTAMAMLSAVNERIKETPIITGAIMYMFNSAQAFSYAVYTAAAIYAKEAIDNVKNASLWEKGISYALFEHKFNEYDSDTYASTGPNPETPTRMCDSVKGSICANSQELPCVPEDKLDSILDSIKNNTYDPSKIVLCSQDDGRIATGSIIADYVRYREACVSKEVGIEHTNMFDILQPSQFAPSVGLYLTANNIPIPTYTNSSSSWVSNLESWLDSVTKFLPIDNAIQSFEFNSSLSSLEGLYNYYKSDGACESIGLTGSSAIHKPCCLLAQKITKNLKTAYDNYMANTSKVDKLIHEAAGMSYASLPYKTKLSEEDFAFNDLSENLAEISLSQASRSLLKPIVANKSVEFATLMTTTNEAQQDANNSKEAAEKVDPRVKALFKKIEEKFNNAEGKNNAEKITNLIKDGGEFGMVLLFTLLGLLPYGAVTIAYSIAYYTACFAIALSLIYIPLWVVFTAGKMMMIATASEENYQGVSMFPIIQFFGMFAVIALEASVLSIITPTIMYYFTCMREFASAGLVGILLLATTPMTGNTEDASLALGFMLKSVGIFGFLTGLATIPAMLMNLLRGQIYQPTQSANFSQGMQQIGQVGSGLGHKFGMLAGKFGR